MRPVYTRFMFFESFPAVIEALPEKDEQQRLLWAIYEYGAKGIEPEFDSIYLAAAFEGIRPNIDASVRSCLAGKAGGKKAAANRRELDGICIADDWEAAQS